MGIGGAKELKISAITTVTTKIRFDIGQPRSEGRRGLRSRIEKIRKQDK